MSRDESRPRTLDTPEEHPDAVGSAASVNAPSVNAPSVNVGEDAFASMMTREWADKLAAKGGIGLADRIFEALIARGGDRV